MAVVDGRPINLVGVRAKIERARVHMNELEKATESWLENNAETVLTVERDGDWEVAYVVVPAIRPFVPVVLGEIVHNLRSALDQAVWQLVRKLGGTPGSHTGFPVAVTKADFEGLVTARKNRNGRVWRGGCLDPIPPGHPAFKLIREHQPYKRVEPYMRGHAENEWLAVVHRLWNIDKHRSVIQASLTCPKTEQSILDLFGWDPNASLIEHKVNHALLNGPLEGGEKHELLRCRFEGGTARSQPHLHGKGTFPGEVMLYCRDNHPTAVRFGHGIPYVLIERVSAVIDDLTPFIDIVHDGASPSPKEGSSWLTPSSLAPPSPR